MSDGVQFRCYANQISQSLRKKLTFEGAEFLALSEQLIYNILAHVKRKCKGTLRNRVLKKKLGFTHMFLTRANIFTHKDCPNAPGNLLIHLLKNTPARFQVKNRYGMDVPLRRLKND